MINKIRAGWLGTIVLLFFYSFTQVDLGLTLTRASWWQVIQRQFQLIGYFNRPLSTWSYLILLALLFIFYFLILRAIQKNKFKLPQIWQLILLTAAVLWLSYNAFSYDFFNYIFDAKIVTFYQQNPYQHKALDFIGDPMLGFMHWTHRLYPYGPLWLGVSIPLSFLGFQKLLPTMILFKGLGVGSYLLACWSIKRILAKVQPKKQLLGLALFAFNPLIIIESLVSAHNDVLMMALALLAFWFLVKKKPWLGWLFLILSIGIKFATVLLAPVFIWVTWRKAKIDWQKIWLISFGLMVVALLLATKRTELQPWYLLYPLAFIAFLSREKWLVVIMSSLSIGLLFHYAPFLYSGNWDPPIPLIKFWLTIGFLVIGVVISAAKKTRSI